MFELFAHPPFAAKIMFAQIMFALFACVFAPDLI